ncbi:acetolactate synthase large subunit [Flexivirga caeni]|uniref:Acetolactate synthase large subunit n=2 Tax=Flexivirga caeni TaxID=2294115 RepID=A0A3M9MBM2_9MICO|nr:acetolactate synthase large subunit [Flexivirga caeni]
MRSGIEVCFANPGTTEMAFVAALDEVPGVRAVLGLHENVCTGAADGYARIAGRPAMTLLHLGPGLANGLANLHNARRANTPVVNIVGEHASWHLPYDAPLSSDIAALAATVGTTRTVRSRADIGAETIAVIADARIHLGVSTLIVPADYQYARATDAEPVPYEATARPVVSADRIEAVARQLREAGRRATIVVGGNGLSRRGQRAAGQIAAHTGAVAYSETFPATAERGGGLPDLDRLPYFPERAISALAHSDVVAVAGAEEPVAYFGYENVPSLLCPAGSLTHLARPHEDAEQALVDLALALAADGASMTAIPSKETIDSGAKLTGDFVGKVVAARLPENAIVSVEGGTCGYPFYTAAAGSVPHTVLTNTGGAIGQGLPCALGAAIAAPTRPVIALQSDGSALYTTQALWTMAREDADVVVLIAANHSYNVLRTELSRSGNAEFGPQAERLTSLDDPLMDWTALAAGFGVPAYRAGTAGELDTALSKALADGGPHLIEMSL